MKSLNRLHNRESIAEAIYIRKEASTARDLWRNGEQVYMGGYQKAWIQSDMDYMEAEIVINNINTFVGPDEWVDRLLNPEKYEDWMSFDSIFSFIKTMQKELREYPEGHIKNELHRTDLETSILRAIRRKKQLAKTVRYSPRESRKEPGQISGNLQCHWCRYRGFVVDDTEAQCKSCGAWMQKDGAKWLCLHNT
jgi:hypothetical protein